jgi:hypothetical protein
VFIPGYVPSPFTVTVPTELEGVSGGTSTLTVIWTEPEDVNGMVVGSTVVVQPVLEEPSSVTITVPMAGGLSTVTVAWKVAEPMAVFDTSTVTSCGLRGDMVKVGFKGMGWLANASVEGQDGAIKSKINNATINECWAMLFHARG